MPKTMTKANEAVKASETEKAAEKPKDVQNTQTDGGNVTYTARELTAASETALHVPLECAAAAFKQQNKERLTLAEAKDIVEKFMKKEVK